MKKQIMTRAWQIAREGAAKFGGNAREYMAAALRMAWEEIKMIEKLVKKYNIRIHPNGTQIACDKYIAKDAKAVAFVKEHKAEIISYIKAAEEAERKAAEERAAKIAAIEGLAEIKAAKDDLDAWHNEFARSFADVGGLGVRRKPEHDIAALNAKYPRAAAYLRAEAYAYASHYAKSGAGKKALERIINGDDYDAAIADMEAEWQEHCNGHIWD